MASCKINPLRLRLELPTKIIFCSRIPTSKYAMDEIRESRNIKIRSSVLHKAHQKAVDEGKTVGRWIEDAIEEKIERGKEG